MAIVEYLSKLDLGILNAIYAKNIVARLFSEVLDDFVGKTNPARVIDAFIDGVGVERPEVFIIRVARPTFFYATRFLRKLNLGGNLYNMHL